MSTTLLLELFGGFMGGCFALWLATQSLSSPRSTLLAGLAPLGPAVLTYLQRPGLLGSTGLLLLRLSVGVMMIHHGQEKLADPQQFANTYVASLHLPFPLLFAYLAGFSELIGSWLVILGLLTPLGALALTGTMATAAYQHILTAGLNIYVLSWWCSTWAAAWRCCSTVRVVSPLMRAWPPSCSLDLCRGPSRNRLREPNPLVC